MVILSVHSSSSLYNITAALPWISSSSLSIAHSCSTLKQSGSVRSLRSSAVFCDAKAEMVEDKKKESAAATAVSASASHELRTFLDARSDLLYVVQREAEEGKLPQNVAQGMLELYQNYRNAVLKTKDPKADEIVLSNMAVAFDRIFLDVKDPFEFSPHHKAIREPFDYYVFGQNYIRPLIDFRNSYVGNVSLFTEIEETVQKGENVILISNHQTEADPAVIALLLESTHPYLAENMIYVAGDRVITDPLCKPFSIGRNLLCVYSKKHMGDVPELVDMKKKANTRSLKEMAVLLRGGSKIIWIAPSGGRDRPDPVTQEWSPAPFDPSSVDNMRRLVEHAAVPGHIYPLAVLCNDIMPPPPQVEKEIGEERVMSFHGVGLSVAPNINFHGVADSIKDHEEEAKNAYSKALFNSVNQQYKVLTSAIHGKQGLKASTTTVSLSQPWQ
ncbi:PREDICTED: glycerol-3-phosphate acyltransferase, chloroplastic isoform X2 [Ipomoea nil]|uniref:glycerol-3-phosphate acyltransferase, chloroplastic isoform X2 n=1 Tax=Ipomoea nil TaxID=35883 RepID=UPI000900FDB2|nr:PREDICTED: glycerol-3-phosphate acyltransferase, chloroplastic isoform X2 [Ipomoea nil]